MPSASIGSVALLVLLYGCAPSLSGSTGTDAHREPASKAAPATDASAKSSSANPIPETTWKSVGWGGGGFYWSCAFDAANDGVLYLGGDVNGFYKSTDHGQHFRMSNHGLGHYAVYAMTVDAAHPGTLYVGTPSALYASRDSGETWSKLSKTAELRIVADRGKSVRSLVTDASGALYAGTPTGKLFRSGDGGNAWEELKLGVAPAVIGSVSVSVRDPKYLLVASDVGIVRSIDRGATWTRPKGPNSARNVVIAQSDDHIAYAAGKGGVWRSSDRGATWTSVSHGIDPKHEPLQLAIAPGDPNWVTLIASAGWSGAFYSTRDGGVSWTATNRLTPDTTGDPTNANGAGDFSAVSNLAQNPHNPNELYIAANWRNAYSSDGGKTWQERERGADITVATDVRFANGSTYVTAMDEGLFQSTDDGASWKQLVPTTYSRELSGHQWRVAILPQSGRPSRIVSTSSPWDLDVNQILTSDDGSSFQIVLAGLPKRRPKANTTWGEGYARALAVDPTDPRRLYLGIDGDPEGTFEGGGVFVSQDGGSTWRRTPGQPASRRVFYGLAVDPTNDKRLYWGATGDSGGLYRSDDAGHTWLRVFDKQTWIFNVEVSKSGVVYCPGNDLWRSDDHGSTWNKLTSFGDSLPIVGIALDPNDEKRLWISRVNWAGDSSGGVFRSTDGGASWVDITSDLPNRKPLVLRYDPATRQLWAASPGIYRIQQ